MSQSFGTVTERGELVAHLDARNVKSWPGSGTTWFDMSGNGNNFTLYNSPTNDGESFAFVSGSSQYARSTSTLDLSGTNSVTVECCWKVDSVAANKMLFEHTSDYNTNAGAFGVFTNSNNGSVDSQPTTDNDLWTSSAVGTLDTGPIEDCTTYSVSQFIYTSGTGVQHYNNNVEPTVSASTTSTVSNFANDYFFIGSRNGTFFYDGTLNLMYIKVYTKRIKPIQRISNYENVRASIGKPYVAPPALYSFSSHTFDTGVSTATINSDARFSEGATLAEYQTAYSSTSWASNLDYFNLTTRGIQVWTVPRTGIYNFTIEGASVVDANEKPSYATSYSQTQTNSKGASVTATIPLSIGQQLTLIVGQSGQPSTQSSSQYGTSGGCGASWVFLADGTSLSTLTESRLLCVAGGAGGGTNNTITCHAGTSLVGTAPALGTIDAIANSVATGGNGGAYGHDSLNIQNYSSAGGGAGVNSNGGMMTGWTPRDGSSANRTGTYLGRSYDIVADTNWHGQGGFAPKNGAQGGMGFDGVHQSGGFTGHMFGGFGGGGGSADNVGAGGGGGGYNGGCGGACYGNYGNGNDWGEGTGGSSFVASAWRSSATATVRNSFGNGSIVISLA